MKTILYPTCLAAALCAFLAIGDVLFTSGRPGDIILTVSTPWSIAGRTIDVSATYYDFATKVQTDITASGQWLVEPAGASVADGKFTATISNVYVVSVVHASLTQSVAVIVVPYVAPEDDSDGDGLPDAWELAHGLNPNDPRDAFGDNDGDGISNLLEYLFGTDPNVAEYEENGTVSSDAISNPDRLVYNENLGWCGKTRQVAALWPPFTVNDLHHASSTGPNPATLVTAASNSSPVTCYAGDRLYLSARADSIAAPAIAGNVAITFATASTTNTHGLNYGVVDSTLADSYHFATYGGHVTNTSIPGWYSWEAEQPSNATLVSSVASIYESTWYYHQSYLYASAPRSYLHFTHSLYRVEFADQITPTAYSKDYICQFITNSAAETVAVKGRLLHSPDIPESYVNEPGSSTIKCRWRYKQSDEWSEWSGDNVAFAELDSPYEHADTHLDNVAYRYFSIDLPTVQTGVYELDLYYDINGNDTLDDNEEVIAAGFGLLTPDVIRVWEKQNPINMIYNPTPKDPREAAANVMYVVESTTCRVCVLLPKYAGSGTSPLKCRLVKTTSPQTDYTSFDAAFNVDGVAEINLVAIDPLCDSYLLLGYDIDGNSQLLADEAIMASVVVDNSVRIPVVFRVCSMLEYDRELEKCLEASRSWALWLFSPQARSQFRLFTTGTEEARYRCSEVSSYNIDVLRTQANEDPVASSCYSEWLDHNAGACFTAAGLAKIKLCTHGNGTRLATNVGVTEPFGLPDNELLAAHVYSNVVPVALIYFVSNPNSNVVVIQDEDRYDADAGDDKGNAYIEDSSIQSRDLSVNVGSATSDERATFGRARVKYVSRQFMFERAVFDGQQYLILTKMHVRVVIEDLYDYWWDDTAAPPFWDWVNNVLHIDIEAGYFGRLQVGFGRGAVPDYTVAKIFIIRAISDGWHDVLGMAYIIE